MVCTGFNVGTKKWKNPSPETAEVLFGWMSRAIGGTVGQLKYVCGLKGFFYCFILHSYGAQFNEWILEYNSIGKRFTTLQSDPLVEVA